MCSMLHTFAGLQVTLLMPKHPCCDPPLALAYPPDPAAHPQTPIHPNTAWNTQRSTVPVNKHVRVSATHLYTYEQRLLRPGCRSTATPQVAGRQHQALRPLVNLTRHPQSGNAHMQTHQCLVNNQHMQRHRHTHAGRPVSRQRGMCAFGTAPFHGRPAMQLQCTTSPPAPTQHTYRHTVDFTQQSLAGRTPKCALSPGFRTQQGAV
jgi:hypothetical protein